ncbi:hypothetical protein AVEN_190054-1 [Araneus ventricosus]|uniref:Chitin-binding type-2 domain-containing protein n=1 Tax=Araneus ventricosus TaxID=182803 RepID=A0A4Y2MQR6_ARAVE|nr:hypothetical protein AVEN_190054-1 [Araneus ventricosus]
MFRSLRTALLIGSLMIASSYDGGGTDPCQGRDGVVPHPEDCFSYFICTNETSELLTCSEDLSFNRLKRTCDYSPSVDCDADASGDNVSGDRESAGDDTCGSVTSTWVSGVSGSCSEYYRCENGEAYRDSCAEGLLFNTDTLACDHSKNVVCDDESLETNPEDTTQSTMSNINTYGSTTSSLRSTFSTSEQSTTGTKTFSVEPETTKISETINHTSELTESTPLDDDHTTEVPKVSSSFESTLPSKASNPLPELPTEASDPNRNTESTSATAQTTESKTERPKDEETLSTEQKTSTTMHDKRDPIATEQTNSEFATMELSSHQGQTSTKQPTSNVSPDAIYSTSELGIYNQITDDEKDTPFVQETTTAGDQIDGGTNNPSDSTGDEANNSSRTSTEETRHPSLTTEVDTSTASQTTAGDTSTKSQTTAGDTSTPSQTTAGDTSTPSQTTGTTTRTREQHPRHGGDTGAASQTTAGDTAFCIPGYGRNLFTFQTTIRDTSTPSQTTAGDTSTFIRPIRAREHFISDPATDTPISDYRRHETSISDYGREHEHSISDYGGEHEHSISDYGRRCSTKSQTTAETRALFRAWMERHKTLHQTTAGDTSNTSSDHGGEHGQHPRPRRDTTSQTTTRETRHSISRLRRETPSLHLRPQRNTITASGRSEEPPALHLRPRRETPALHLRPRQGDLLLHLRPRRGASTPSQTTAETRALISRLRRVTSSTASGHGGRHHLHLRPRQEHHHCI